jgi:phosphatidate phosphatase PAH1
VKKRKRDMFKNLFKKSAPTHTVQDGAEITKSFLPSQDQLKSMMLNDGKNEVEFTTKSKLTGTKTISARIYLWDYTTKIVISDVDGTVTKSDVRG